MGGLPKVAGRGNDGQQRAMQIKPLGVSTAGEEEERKRRVRIPLARKRSSPRFGGELKPYGLESPSYSNKSEAFKAHDVGRTESLFPLPIQDYALKLAHVSIATARGPRPN